jgi:hypothetical protein
MREDFDLRLLPKFADAIRLNFRTFKTTASGPKLRTNLRHRFRR